MCDIIIENYTHHIYGKNIIIFLNNKVSINYMFQLILILLILYQWEIGLLEFSIFFVGDLLEDDSVQVLVYLPSVSRYFVKIL